MSETSDASQPADGTQQDGTQRGTENRSTHPTVARRQFLSGVGAAAIGLSALGEAQAAAAPAPAGPAPSAASALPPFPDLPTADVTTTQDRLQMLAQLGIPNPLLPPRAQDPNRPPNATPVNPADTEGNWTDPLGHTVARGGFGQWITYDDSAGPAGGAVSPFGPFGVGSSPRYPDIDLLRTNDGRPVRTPEDWWTRRRPEIFTDVQETLYGFIPPAELWPHITWSVGPASTGSANGFAYQERVVTGTVDTSGYPEIRNVPTVRGTLRTPLPLPQDQPVPVIIVFGGSNSEWQFTAPHGMGVCAFDWAALQPDSGGANMSSWIIGLINKGNWRRPRDWGALAAWSWGVSRLIDYFETDATVDATRIGVQGHSRFGKATLVCAAYDERIGAAFPSAAGALGTSWARMTWGENLELVCGADTEYHWVNGTIMRFAGEREPGRYWPRKVWDLPVDAHSVMSLIAPRVVMTSGGTDIPPGFGDAWTNPRGMYLAGAVSSPVWERLGWPGLIVPDGTVFTSGPGEAPGGTPPIDAAFIDGTVGWRRHHQGHTPIPDWPSFMELTARHFNDSRPVVVPAQRLALGTGPAGRVGTLTAGDADRDPLGNWQVVGGTGVGKFTVEPATGAVTIQDARALARDLGRTRAYTLTVTVDDRKLTSAREVVTIDVPDRVRVSGDGRTRLVSAGDVRGYVERGYVIGQA